MDDPVGKAIVALMDEQTSARRLAWIRWIGIGLPVAAVWAVEVIRSTVIDQLVDEDAGHVVGALVMTVAVLAFGIAITTFLERTQRQLVRQNRDLAATHSVSSAVRGGVELTPTLEIALDRLVAETRALGGRIAAQGPGGNVVLIQRPPVLPEQMGWLTRILDAGPTALLERAEMPLPSVDALVLDLPLVRAGASVGALRLVFHPPIRPPISDAALADVAGEIATAAQVGRLVADLRRREHETKALNEVALQMTGVTELRQVLDSITGHARDLLSADRAVVCLSERRDGRSSLDRIALADDGEICTLRHTFDEHDPHPRTPECPLALDGETAFTARPLRGTAGFLGELCVARAGDRPFGPEERDLLGALADMAAIAVGTARLREAEEQLAIVGERDRIARELHDSIAQVLGVLHLRLRALTPAARATSDPTLATALDELAETADEAYRDVREAILGLRETVTSDAGLEGALREYLHKFTRQTGIVTTLVCEGPVRSLLTPRSEVQLLRVVQEALTNVRKHSGARRAAVRLGAIEERLVLEVEDDGRGFDPAHLEAALDHGFGLSSMKERAEQVGGSFAVHTAPERGTTITVTLEPEETRAEHAAAAADPAGR